MNATRIILWVARNRYGRTLLHLVCVVRKGLSGKQILFHWQGIARELRPDKVTAPIPTPLRTPRWLGQIPKFAALLAPGFLFK